MAFYTFELEQLISLTDAVFQIAIYTRGSHKPLFRRRKNWGLLKSSLLTFIRLRFIVRIYFYYLWETTYTKDAAAQTIIREG